MRIAVPEVIEPADQLGVVHFIGIGGAGLSAIARIMAGRGITVQGSDAQESAVMLKLRAEGITCFAGHDAAHLDGVTTVIASTAVPEDNPEIRGALQRGLRLWPRSAGLKSLMTGQQTVAVAGTHGKTTTTAMLSCALLGAGVDPTFSIGAEVAALGTNARVGSDPIFVVEADESDGAFLTYHPEVGVVTNVDADHLDNWGTVEAYDQAFEEFVATVSQFLVLSHDDAKALRLRETGTRQGLTVLTAGFHADAAVRGSELTVEGSMTRFTVSAGSDQTEVTLAVPGEHYAQDALLAIAAGQLLGYGLPELATGLAKYTGASRRMEHKGEVSGVDVYDSYAHHPTEIAADIAAGRAIADGRRLIVAFQPHLVSRTRQFAVEMARSLDQADVVALADIYLAREAADPAVSSSMIADRIQNAPVHGPYSLEELSPALAKLADPGDVVLTLGAGDITTVGPALLELLSIPPEVV